MNFIRYLLVEYYKLQKMKISKLILSLITLLLVFSCAKDETANIPVTEDNVAAEWNLTDLTMDGQTKYLGVNIPIKGKGKDMDAKITLTKNPNKITSSGSLNLNVSFSLLGQSVDRDIPINLNLLIGSGDWSINSKGQLLISTNDKVQVVNVKEFNNNTMKLETEYEFNVPYNGIELPISSKLNMTLTK